MFAAAGAITDEELLTFRQFGSRLEGHPTPLLPWVDVATGSLGQGMPIAAAIALCARDLDRLPYRVFTLCGDSEMAEGSIWEAVEHAGKEGLDNLVTIVDVNRLGQRGETMHGWDLNSYADRARASGWHAIEIDGHDIAAIDRAFSEAEATADRPTMIVARTIKGYGASETADKEGKHGQPLKDPEKAIEELGNVGPVHVDVAKPESTGHAARVRRRSVGAAAHLRGRRRQGPDPARVRPGPGGGDAASRRRRRARRRGRQLDPPRGGAQAHSRALLRGLHRRADADGRGRRLPGPRLDAVRVDVRGVPVARL